MWIVIAALVIFIILKYLNRDYYLLAGCKRIKTVDGSNLESRVVSLSGKTIFGNNFDIVGATPESAFEIAREYTRRGGGKEYLLHCLFAPVYSVCTAETAEEVFQSQVLITKSVMYRTVEPFLGLGLLTSTDEQWQFRRKILTPAFHFNILQSFIEVFKEETYKLIEKLNGTVDQTLNLQDVIPQFTLNNVCETAMGVKLDYVTGSEGYRKAVRDLEQFLVHRVCNPILYYDAVYWFTKGSRQQNRLLHEIHDFSSRLISKKRAEFQSRKQENMFKDIDDYGKKKRYAMLDTLLDAETQGLIDHHGICDEVNTFMFEGYDTTSACLMFALVNLALHQDLQQKCYEEIQDSAPIEELTVFDLNKLEYLECFIKETLRLYPSVPFIARAAVKETIINGLILPANTQVLIHIFDILRDEKHFPNPNQFDPERFRPENTTNRHPFAFVPFSAGPRNCIGQKFAMLEIKMLLVAILKRFVIQPITRMEDVIFENGLVLRSKQNLQVKIIAREL